MSDRIDKLEARVRRDMEGVAIVGMVPGHAYLALSKLATIAREAEDSVRDLMGAMRRWGAEEDGIPGDSCIGAWQAYEHAKCLLCPSRHEFRCTLYDEQRNTICEPCPVCGAIRKHSFASFIVLNADGTSAVVCNDTCARKYQAAREAVKS